MTVTTAQPAWTRLIRFIPPNSTSVLFGEPLVSDSDDVGKIADAESLEAHVVEVGPAGPLGEGGRVTDRVEKVGTLLAPIGIEDVTDFKCIGLNYRKHSEWWSSRCSRGHEASWGLMRDSSSKSDRDEAH